MIMKDKMIRIFKSESFLEWYYLIVIFAYIATLTGDFVRPGMIAAVLMCAVVVELIFKKKMNIHSVMDVLIVVYFVYRGASVIWLLKAGVMPVSVYTGEFAVSLLPMIFYFAGRGHFGKDEVNSKSFYKKFLISLIVLGVVSAILYGFAPQFYCDYLYRWSYISKADASTAHVRMQSVVGSTIFGAIMVLGMTIAVHFMCYDSKEADAKKVRIFGAISFAATMIFAILSNQRSSMVAAFVVLVYVNYLLFTRFDYIPRKYAYIEIGAVAAIVILVLAVKPDFVMKVWARIASLPSAVSERSEQWVAAVNNMYSSWFGNGLGSNGHRAVGIEGSHVIADGGLIKMYCEEGVLGFSLFIYILFLTMKKGIRNIGLYYAEIATIAMTLITSIGSNVIAFQLVTPIFWFVIGRIWENCDDTEIFSIKGKARR